MGSVFSGYKYTRVSNDKKEDTKKRSTFSGYKKYGTSYNEKNQGGFLGGLGFVGGSAVAGLGGILEGVIDASIAPLADIFGDHEYAKYLFKNNVVGDWHKSLASDYNPGTGWSFAGDVAHGMGQSSVLLIPYAGKAMFFQGIIAQSISNAAEQTGEVGVKEAAYGFISGGIEGGLEVALGAAGSIGKSIGSAAAKKSGSAALKSIFSSAARKGLAKKIISDAAGEFLEEAASEVADTYLQRWFKINPDKQLSWKDVARAGLVGAVSGGIMSGTATSIETASNRARGRQIIQNGNAQTLVNTANSVADKLAGQGTDFKNATEWVKKLRGEVDAYNKLVKNGKQNSASAEVILGELQASLFFSETQAVTHGLTFAIQNQTEENRAALAEYVNRTVDKKDRPRDYTADDIAKNVDEIATSLAIMQFTGASFFDFDGAMADMAREQGINDVIGQMQSDEAQRRTEEKTAQATKDDPSVSAADSSLYTRESSGEPSPSAEPTPLPEGEAMQGEEPSPSPSSDGATSPEGRGVTVNQANAGIFDASAGVSTEGEVAKSDLASPLTDAKYSVATAKRAQKRIKENAARAERARQARLDQEGRMVEGTNQEQSAEATPSTADAVPLPREGGNSEPIIRKAKEEILTDEQRAQRARERAEKWIDYEKKIQPTVQERNKAREYVKEFDSLPREMQISVIRMIRSAKGVDPKTVKGVANLMTMRRRDGRLVMPDLELRFAEGIVDGGLYTHIGEGENRRVLILINSDADFKKTVKGTIAHEIVHYIENRKGYRELADYVLKTAKKEKIAEIEKEYNEHYKGIYTAEAEKAGLTGEAITKKVAERMATEEHKELIKSEVVAKLIGLRLNNEKFLKKYATKDDAMIKKIFRYLRASVSYLKDKDKATADEIRELVNKFNDVLGASVVSESAGTKTAKYSFAGKKAETADKLKLATAQEMLANGVDSETVRKKTGWFKGYDGKWRFEIDDSDIKLLDLSKLAVEDEGLLHDLETNPDTHVTDTIVYKGRLKDVIEHPALFKAYPELKDVSFYMEWTDFSETGYSFEGYYTPLGNQIYIDKRMAVTHSKKLEAIKNTPEYKKYQNVINDETIPSDKWFEMVGKAEKEFFSSVPGKQYQMLQYKDNSEITKLSEEGKRVLIHEIQHAIQNIEGFSSGASATESDYEKAAGEIEARDVANRADMTAEERKNTRPDIDREDVVFAGKTDVAQSIERTTDNRPVVVVNDDILKGVHGRSAEIAAVKQALTRFDKVPVHKQTILITGDSADEVTRSKHTETIRKKNKTIYEDKMRIMNHPVDIILASTDFINEAPKHPRKDDIIDFARGTILLQVHGRQYSAEVVYGYSKKGTCRLHDIVKIVPDSFVIKKSSNSLSLDHNTVEYRRNESLDNDSIPQNSDLSIGSEKKVDGKRDLAPRKKKAQAVDKSKLNENGEVKDEFFTEAVGRMYQEETRRAQNTAEAYKEGNKILNKKLETQKKLHEDLVAEIIKLEDRVHHLENQNEAYKEGNKTVNELLSAARKRRNKAVIELEELRAEFEKLQKQNEAYKEGNKKINKKLDESRSETAKLKRENRSLTQQIAKEAYEADAKTFTQKEIDALVERINQYSTDKFKDIMDDKKATISKIDKDQFAYNVYVAFHTASSDKRVMDRMEVFADKLAKQYLDDVFYMNDGKRVYLKDIFDEASYKQYVNVFRRKIMASFKQMGRETTHARLTAHYRAEMAKLQNKLLDTEAKGKNLRELQWQAKQLRTTVDIQKRSPQDEGIYNVEKEMSRIADERGRVSAKQADKAFEKFYVFLTSDSEKADSSLAEMAQVEGESLVSLIEEYKHLRKGHEGKYLNSQELAIAAKIIAGGRKILREYNRVFFNGHWVDMKVLAEESVKDLTSFSGADKEYKTKVGKFLGEKLGKTLNQLYFYNVLSPETVIETLEGFKKNGVLKTLYHTVRVATQKAEHLSVQMKKPFSEFLDNKENAWTDDNGKKHSFRNKLNKKMINVNGAEITLGEAIYLYMLTKREHAHRGLEEGGYITYDENNHQKNEVGIKIHDFDAARSFIDGQLESTDRAFLEMAEKFFNETATKIKYDADMKILGYTNNQEGYYVPIIRDRYENMANVTDQRQSIGSIVTVYNKSFTQNLVQNAKALEGKNIMEIINDHADGLADYSELYLPLKSFDRIYNARVINDKAQATSIRKVLNNNVWNGSDNYFKRLFADIQGQGSERGFLDGMIGKLRSGWVNSVLGANVKVVATQTTSYVAANQLIEAKYLSAAASKFVGNIDEIRERAYKYSDIIEARNFEMGSLRAQGNIDKVNEIGKKSGFLIGWMDERICLSIFHAAELKAEAQGHGAVGTESNSIAAAKIADEVIYTTQAMTSQAERSALQRSKSEVARTLAMFTSDSVKQLSHLYRNVMQFVAHKQRSKSDTAYEAELSKDAKMIGRSAATVLTTGIMLGLITQAFKYLYAQEEEEPEEKAKDFALDMVSSTFNIMPIVSDIADKFVFGYDLSLNVFDIVNDTIEDTSALFKMTGKAMGGQYVSSAEVGKNLINAAKTYTTLFGVPLAPVERTVTGLMRRFTPSAVYGYDAMFKNPSYTADLQRAVEKGDEQLAEHILGQLYRNEVTGVYTSEELEIVADLYSKGYTSVIPQRVGETINDVKLDRKQRQQFNKIYAQASSKIMEMIATAEFKALSEEQQAKAIKNLYSLYYNRAASTVAGKEVSNAQMYSWLTDNYSALFTSQAYKGGLDVIKDSKGKEVSVRDQFVEYAQNLGLSESDLLVVEFANGVRDKKTKAALIEHINTLTLSDEQKAVIAEKLSLEVKDGKLVEKKE